MVERPASVGRSIGGTVLPIPQKFLILPIRMCGRSSYETGISRDVGRSLGLHLCTAKADLSGKETPWSRSLWIVAQGCVEA
jgi:hypothetical protein